MSPQGHVLAGIGSLDPEGGRADDASRSMPAVAASGGGFAVRGGEVGAKRVPAAGAVTRFPTCLPACLPGRSCGAIPERTESAARSRASGLPFRFAATHVRVRPASRGPPWSARRPRTSPSRRCARCAPDRRWPGSPGGSRCDIEPAWLIVSLRHPKAGATPVVVPGPRSCSSTSRPHGAPVQSMDDLSADMVLPSSRSQCATKRCRLPDRRFCRCRTR